jgi:hypothetical protein
VEIAVDMLSLAGRYDTAVLVSGDEDFVYAVNAVAYKGCRVEVAGFRSNTAPKLIDVADYFIDLGDIAHKVRKEPSHPHRYYENHAPPNAYANHTQAPSADDELDAHAHELLCDAERERDEARRTEEFDESVPRLIDEPVEDERGPDGSNFIRVTDDQ